MIFQITYNNFEISLVVFMPNITINHAITYTNFETVKSLSKAMFTPYRIAFTTGRKPYRIWLLFTHKDTGFGAISLTERSCAAPISKGDVTLDDSQRRFSAQHSVATLLRHCFEWLQHCSSIATMSCAKNRCCKSSHATSP